MGHIATLEHFGAAAIRNPYGNPPNKKLWMAYEADDTEPVDRGHITLSPQAAHDGARGLRYHVTAGAPYLYFYPWSESAKKWFPLSDQIQTSNYAPLRYHRLSFWVKTPANLWHHPNPHGPNLHVADFMRGSYEQTKKETGWPRHTYKHHRLLPFPIPIWHHVESDWDHWHHVRNANTTEGQQEWGLRPHPTGEPHRNALDVTTAFYVDFKSENMQGGPAYPAEFDFNTFQLIEAHQDENRLQVYNVTSGYAADSHTVYATWSCHRKEQTFHEVRYAFTSIRQTGWAAATPAPDGTVSAPGGDYNILTYQTDSLPLTGRSTLYLAIKPVTSSHFREVIVPLG